MNKLTTKRLLPFLLAMVMIFGTISPAFAAGFDGSNEPVQKTESELISKNGKLRAKLVVPQKAKVQKRSMVPFGGPAKALAKAPEKAPEKAPGFGKTIVKVNIVKHGIGTNPFNFDAVFGATPDTKVTLINWDTDETQEATVNKDTQSVTFDNPVTMEDIEDGVYSIEFEGTKVAGKITFEESASSYDGKTYITTYTLDLYQIRNTDVVVTTKTVGGTVVDNPTTAATNGKIKLTAGKVTATIDIPAGTDATETVKNINTRNKNEINKGVAFEIEDTENGVLVDKTAKKVYKPGTPVIDEDGLKPTEIKFTEKPLVTTDDMSSDSDYVKVTFAQGDHGTIATNKTYYVYKGVTMKSTLDAPEVTPNKDWKFTTWDPALATKYDEGKTHVAQYNYNGNDVVPQPGEDKPDVPGDFVLVEFKAGEHGTLSGTTKYWVNPEAGKKLSDVTKPEVTPENNWKHTGWDKADTTAITKALEVTAQYKAKVVTEDPGDEAYVKVDFAAGAHGTIAEDATKEYWVLKNEEVTLAAPSVTANEGWTQKTGADAWDKPLTASYTTDTTITAQYNYNGNDVVPQPGDDKPNVPDNFVLVEFKAGDHGTLSGTTKYWVNPEAGKTLADVTKPTVTPENNWKHTGWDKADTEAIGKGGLTVTAQYKEKVVTENPNDQDYVKVDFAAGAHGTIAADATKEYWVLKNEEVTLAAPSVTANEGWTQKTGADAWDKPLTASYTTDTTITAQYNYNGNDVVPQPGDDKPNVPDNFVLVEFKAGEHGTLSGTTKYWVNPEAGKKLSDVTKPEVTPENNWKHTGWDKADTTAITKALEVTAQYKAKVVTEDPGDEAYVKVDFAAGAHGTIAEDATKEYWVLKNEEVTLAAPSVTANEGWTQKTGADAWDKPLTASYTTDTTITAQYNYNGNDVVPQPGDDKPNVPDNFVLVEFKAGDHGTLSGTTKYWVNPEAGKTLADVTKPTVTPENNWKHTGWDKADTEAIGKGGLTVTAQYKEKVVTENPNDQDYVKVDFAAGAHGTIAADATKEYWVLKNEEVTLAAPSVTANEGWTQKTGADAWDKPLTASYTTDTTITAQYTYNGTDIVPQPGDDKPNVPDNFVLVEFKPGDHGTLSGTTKYWVNPEAGKTLADVTKPGVTAEENWSHTGWDKADTTAITGKLEVTAQYTQNPSIVTNPVQKYDEAKDDQYIEGVLPEGKTLPNGATVELVVKNGDNYEKVDVPVTTDGGVIKVDVKNDNIQHGGMYYFAITENGKTTSYSDTPVTIDKQGPSMGTAGNEITLDPDAYGYQVKVSANASDDSGILRVYAEEDKSADNSYYDADASKTTANLTESIQNQLGQEKEFTVTAVDKFGNKTIVKKTAEATKTPIMIKAERPLDGDDFIYVTTEVGASLEIKVIDANKEEVFTMTHTQGQASEEIKLDGAFKLTKGQRVKVKGSIAGKEDNTLTIRVR